MQSSIPSSNKKYTKLGSLKKRSSLHLYFWYYFTPVVGVNSRFRKNQDYIRKCHNCQLIDFVKLNCSHNFLVRFQKTKMHSFVCINNLSKCVVPRQKDVRIIWDKFKIIYYFGFKWLCQLSTSKCWLKAYVWEGYMV